VTDVRVEQKPTEPMAIYIYFNDGQPVYRLLAGFDPSELQWIAEQIRLKWQMRDAAQ
jgi:hypothetical protein